MDGDQKPDVTLAGLKGDQVLRLSESAEAGANVKGDLGATVAGADTARAAVRASHAEILGRAASARALPEDDGATEEVIPALPEDILSIELKLPDGRIAVMAPPGGLTQHRAAMLAGTGPDAPWLMQLAIAILYVRMIDGAPPPALNNKVDLLKWCAELGDKAVDHIFGAHQLSWPTVTTRDLVIVKKTVRTPTGAKL